MTTTRAVIVSVTCAITSKKQISHFIISQKPLALTLANREPNMCDYFWLRPFRQIGHKSFHQSSDQLFSKRA